MHECLEWYRIIELDEGMEQNRINEDGNMEDENGMALQIPFFLRIFILQMSESILLIPYFQQGNFYRYV